MKRARYIVIEGTEGVGKTTQVKKLADYLTDKGYKVLQTKEPGTPHIEITMQMRELMLSNKYDKSLTKTSRELLSQAIRSIHLEHLVFPALNDYDFIVQDRGILSGLAYGEACGNNIDNLIDLNRMTVMFSKGLPDHINDIYNLYDNTIFLHGDLSSNLDRAKNCKQEFEEGDAMESQNSEFYQRVERNFKQEGQQFYGFDSVAVDNKNIDEVFDIILDKLNIKQ